MSCVTSLRMSSGSFVSCAALSLDKFNPSDSSRSSRSLIEHCWSLFSHISTCTYGLLQHNLLQHQVQPQKYFTAVLVKPRHHLSDLALLAGIAYRDLQNFPRCAITGDSELLEEVMQLAGDVLAFFGEVVQCLLMLRLAR